MSMTAPVGKKHHIASWLGTGALAVPVVVGGWIILAKRNSLSAPEPTEVSVARVAPATGPADEPDEEALRLRAQREETRRLEEEQERKAEQEEVAQKKEAFVRKVPGTAAVKGTGRTKVSSVPAAPPPPPAGIFLAPALSTPNTPAPGEGPGPRIYTSEDATPTTPAPAPPKPARRQR
jgi:hypothetical protein